MKNLSLRAKLFAVLGLLSAVAIVISAIGITRLGSINSSLNRIVEVTSTKQLLSNQMQSSLLAISRAEKNLILAQTKEEMDKYAEAMQNFEKQLEEQKAKLIGLMDDSEKQVIQDYDKAFAVYKDIQAKACENSRRNTNLQAFELSKGAGRELFDKGEKLIRSLADRADKQVTEAVAGLKTSSSDEVKAKLTNIDDAATRAILANHVVEDFVVLQRAEKNLILEQTAENMQKFAKELQGRHTQLNTRLSEMEKTATEQGKKEIQEFRAAVAAWMENNKKVDALSMENSNEEARRLSCTEGRAAISAAEAVLDQLSETADNAMIAEAKATDRLYATARMLMLSVSIGGIGFAVTLGFFIVRGLVSNLRRTVVDLSEGARQVNEAANQVSQASQTLAEGASEQASSLEETSSALEEMAAMTRTNAGSAKEANVLAAQSRKAADEGNHTVVKLNEAMTGINESSGKISKIIKVIEEIAFQTNLLALNAAVEAARAGEHGKGFAVVADEVRNLAQRCAQAAKETTSLIEDAVNRSRDGTQVANDVGKALGAIANDTSKVSTLIDAISKASDEQAQGVDQVNIAVSQMDKVTQTNASSAEEAASASEELSAQATATKHIVDELMRVVEGTSAHTASETSVSSGLKAADQKKSAASVKQWKSGGTSKLKAAKSRSEASPELLPVGDDDLKDF